MASKNWNTFAVDPAITIHQTNSSTQQLVFLFFYRKAAISNPQFGRFLK